MKRSAAIIGPTPAFVRWAIHHPCPLREIDRTNLPGSTFRQLRAIQELSLARIENRVMDGVVFHADTAMGGELIGFLDSEIVAAAGGEEQIRTACLSCPANSNNFSEMWAGCYGIARVNQSIVSAFENAFTWNEREWGPALNLATEPRWQGIWMQRVWQGDGLRGLQMVFAQLDEVDRDWQSVRQALDRCVRNQLEFHVEYFPEGSSDGIHWNLLPHCQRCKSLKDADKKHCHCCGEKLVNQAVKKRKVLGLRPYMNLKYVLGAEKCEELVSQYLQRDSTENG